MRLHKLLTGLALGSCVLLGGIASAQSTSGSGGTTQGNDNPSAAGSDQMGNANNPAAGTTSGMAPADTNANSQQASGTLSSVGNNKVELKKDDGSKLTLQTDQATKVFDQSGNVATLSQLKEGEQIRASFEQQGTDNHAIRIDVTKAGVKSDKTY